MVTSETVAKWWPLFVKLAKRYNGLGGAEFDDLVQQQAMYAWIDMERGYFPTEEFLANICRQWVRYISHRGLVYEEHPPIAWALQEDDAYGTPPGL